MLLNTKLWQSKSIQYSTCLIGWKVLNSYSALHLPCRTSAPGRCYQQWMKTWCYWWLCRQRWRQTPPRNGETCPAQSLPESGSRSRCPQTPRGRNTRRRASSPRRSPHFGKGRSGRGWTLCTLGRGRCPGRWCCQLALGVRWGSAVGCQRWNSVWKIWSISINDLEK